MISRCDHIGIMVSDMERSLVFYENILGLTLIERRSHGDLDIAFLKLGDTSLELVAGASGYDRGDAVVNHIAFTVERLEPVLHHLKENGVQLVDEEPRPVWDGHRVAFFRGPDGERLELFERAD